MNIQYFYNRLSKSLPYPLEKTINCICVGLFLGFPIVLIYMPFPNTVLVTVALLFILKSSNMSALTSLISFRSVLTFILVSTRVKKTTTSILIEVAFNRAVWGKLAS